MAIILILECWQK